MCAEEVKSTDTESHSAVTKDSPDTITKDQEPILREILERLDKIQSRLGANVQMGFTGFEDLLKSTKKILYTNFLLGMSRGVGFFLGLTIVGAIFMAFLGFLVKPLLSWLTGLDLPMVGGWIAEIMDSVEQHRSSSPK